MNPTACFKKLFCKSEPSYQEEIFHVVGTDYCLDAIQKLACCSPDWKKSAKIIIAEGKAMQRIFRYNYIHKPVKLIPEPKNPHDKNAVIVQIAGEKVGYIPADQAKHVQKILRNQDIKFISAFISGGPYKVISENGDVENLENSITVKIKIGYQ